MISETKTNYYWDLSNVIKIFTKIVLSSRDQGIVKEIVLMVLVVVHL